MAELPPEMLQAILDEPGDDGIRLICADWLDENGDADDLKRAEFIRVQVKIALLSEGQSEFWKEHDSRYAALRQRERELWPVNVFRLRDQIGEALPPNAVLYKDDERPGFTPHTPELYVRRGFVAEVSCTLTDFTAHAAALFAAAPVEAVRLSDADRLIHTDRDGSRPTLIRDFLIRTPGLQACYHEVYRLVESDEVASFGRHGERVPSWKRFPTRDALETALSSALVVFGRNAARRLKIGTGMVQESGGVFRPTHPGEAATHVVM